MPTDSPRKKQRRIATAYKRSFNEAAGRFGFRTPAIEFLEGRWLLAAEAGIFGEANMWLPYDANSKGATAPQVQGCALGMDALTPCQIVRGSGGTDSFRVFGGSGLSAWVGNPHEVTVSPPSEEVDSPRFFTITVSSVETSPYELVIFNVAKPALTVTSQWDEPSQGLGPFLYSVPLENRFTIKASLPADLQVQYRLGDKGTWQTPEGGEGINHFTMNVGALPAGSNDIDVRVLSPEGNPLYFYNDVQYIRVLDSLPVDLRFTDRATTHGTTWSAEQVRFLSEVDAGGWKVEVVAPYVPLPEAYADWKFELMYQPHLGSGTTIPSPAFDLQLSSGKVTGSTTVPVQQFKDLVADAETSDYQARIRAIKFVNNTSIVSKPFTAPEPIFVASLPKWMGKKPKVTYELTEALGSKQFAYAIDVDRLKIDQSLPDTAGTPFGLFDGYETYMRSEVDLRVYASPNFLIDPVVKSERWSAQVKVLDRQVLNYTNDFFQGKGFSVTGELEPKLLGLDGGGLLIKVDPKQIPVGSFTRTFKPFETQIPVAWSGLAGIVAKLKLSGQFTLENPYFALEGSIHLKELDGRLLVSRNQSFVKLNIDATAKLEVKGEAALALVAKFALPSELTPAQVKGLKQIEQDLISFIAVGTAEANLKGAVQVNFQGFPPGLWFDFDDSRVDLSGKLSLKYDYCLITNPTVRQFLGLPLCGGQASLKTLYEDSFGPVAVIGKDAKPADPNNPASLASSGTLTGGTGSQTGAASGEMQESGPQAISSGDSLAFQSEDREGTLRFHQPYDERVERVAYSFEAHSRTLLPTPQRHYLEAVLVTSGAEIVLERVDLATLSYSDDGFGGYSSGVVQRQAVVPPAALRSDRMYSLEYRLASDPAVPDELVTASLESLQVTLRGPALQVSTQAGVPTDGIIHFGPDTNGEASAQLALENPGDHSLNIKSVSIAGQGFALVNPPAGELAIVAGNPITYAVRLLDPTRPASAELRIVSNDPNRPTLVLPLRYNGTDFLDLTQPPPSPPRSAPYPSLAPIANQVLEEGAALQLQVSAVDHTPADGLEFTLSEAPAYATVNAATGAIEWNPPEDYLGGVYRFTIRATEPGNEQLFDERSFELTFVKTNQAPRFRPIAEKTVRQQQTLVANVFAQDTDFPSQRLSYSLGRGAPAGARIDAGTGRFEWATTSTTAPGRYEIPIRVTDDGAAPKSTTASLVVTVIDVNEAPVLASIAPRSGAEGQTVTLTAVAVDADGDKPVYRLGPDAPIGATIDPDTGMFQWTPGEADGGFRHSIRVEAVDGRDAALLDYQVVIVDVAETNALPTVNLPDTIAVSLGAEVRFTVDAQDSDIPAAYLEYRLVDAPAGARIDLLDGEFYWVADEQGEHTFTIQITDWQVPRQDVYRSVTIQVGSDQLPPTLVADGLDAYVSPWLFGRADDDLGVQRLEVRSASPASGWLDLSDYLDEGGFFHFDESDLASVLGAEFSDEVVYTFEIRATDAAGNATTISRTFALDWSPPEPAALSFAPGYDTGVLGDRVTTLPVVSLLAQTEPFASLRLLSPDGETLAVGVADALGVLQLDGVPLRIGRHPLEFEVVDQAGNSTYFTSTFTRDTGDGRYGPDAVGYHATSAPIDFRDITQTGQLLLGFGDETGSLNSSELGEFTFSFYGKTYSELFVSPSGLISFESPNTGLPYVLTADDFSSEPAIAPFWSFASVTEEADSGVYWLLENVAGGQQLIVQWNVSVDRLADDEWLVESLRFQAILDSRDGSIQLNFADLLPDDALEEWADSLVGVTRGGDVYAEVTSFVLARGSGPYDLIREGTSLRIERNSSTPPILLAVAEGDEVGGVVTNPTITGFVFSANGITELRGDFDPATPGSFFDLTTWLDPSGSLFLETSDLVSAYGGALADGLLTLQLTAVDALGGISTSTLTFALDAAPPVLHSLVLRRGSDTPPLYDFVTDRAFVDLDGLTDPDVQIELSGPFGAEYAVADEEGRFSFADEFYTSIPLEMGENRFTLTLTDPAGLTSAIEVLITRVAGASIGPDSYGYWGRTVESQFDDIRARGSEVLQGADDGVVLLGAGELAGFSFGFYGQQYDSIWIDSNGGIAFGPLYESLGSFYFGVSPEAAAIAPFGFDLVVAGTAESAVHWLVQDGAAGRQLIVQWTEVFFVGGEGPFSFQVVLNSGDDTFQFNYLDLGDEQLLADLPSGSIGMKAPGVHSENGSYLDLTPRSGPSQLVRTGSSVYFTSDLLVSQPPRIEAHTPSSASWLNEIVLRFDQAMDRDSFSIEEDLLSFTGPQGDLLSAVLGVTWVDARTLQIELAEQLADGTYTLVVSPAIASVRGMELDQDSDGVPGELAEDAYAATVVLARCTPFSAAGYQACGVAYTGENLEPGMPGVFVLLDHTDDHYAAVDLGSNSFRFFDYLATGDSGLYVSANGYLTLGAPSRNYLPSDLSLPAQPATIAPMMLDWANDLDDEDQVLGKFVDLNGDGAPDQLIIEWNRVGTYAAETSEARLSFQVVLGLNTGPSPGAIVFHYLPPDLGESAPASVYDAAAVGIKSGLDTTAGLIVSAGGSGSALVAAGKSLQFVTNRPSGLLRIANESPLIGQVGQIEVVFDRAVTGLDVGDFALTRDGVPIQLTNQGIAGAGSIYQLDLSSLSQLPGVYELTLAAEGAGIEDAGLQPLLSDLRLTWRSSTPNHAPDDIVLSHERVPENSPGSIIGTLSVIEEDAGQTHTWTTSDDRFEVIDGVLKLSPTASLDFENEPIVQLLVTAVDSGEPSQSFTKLLTLLVEDRVDAPRFVQLLESSIKAGVAGAELGNLAISDDDSTNVHHVSVDDSRLEVVDGRVKLRSGQAFSQAGEYSFVVSVVDESLPDLVLTRQMWVQVQANALSWHNTLLPQDATGDGEIAPMDALVIINELNRPVYSGSDGLLAEPPSDSSFFRYDVNNDGYITAIDALIVINWLNSNPFGPQQGEGEAIGSPVTEPHDMASPAADAPAVDAPSLKAPALDTLAARPLAWSEVLHLLAADHWAIRHKRKAAERAS